MYNTEVGYCQGMSQIAALLLMYMNEEVSYSYAIGLLSVLTHLHLYSVADTVPEWLDAHL